MKTVIYKDYFGKYMATNESNYYARIQNAKRIQDLSQFESVQEIIDYYCKWFGAQPDEFIIIE